MPCNFESADESTASMSRELDRKTAQLCEACAVLEENGLLKSVSEDIQLWWIRHKEWDRKRLVKEARQQARQELAANARNKLTAAEREALGVK